MDSKQIVAHGYDHIAERYIEWARYRLEERNRYTAALLEKLPNGAKVLELGCGAGIPTTQQLAQHFAVTGVDISAQSIELAKRNVPTAKFIQADMAKLDFPPDSFDAVAAFYSIIHVPRQEQPKLLREVARWLRPGGWLVATMGINSIETDYSEDWLGIPMYWSSFDSETNKRLVEEAGLHIVSAQEETAEESGVPLTFLWVIAQKPSETPAEVEENIDRVRAIRRQVRLASGRPDGRCGKVAEAIQAELGWAYHWGHLRLLDGGICWIHCWNQLPDGTVVDATADQFEERWLGDVAVLSPGDPLHTCYRSAPPGHLFRTVRAGRRRRLLARRAGENGQFEPIEEELATAPDSRRGWIELGACTVEVHSGWQLPEWIGREAGDRLCEAAAKGQPLPSRELEFALDAVARRRRIASHGEWTSPEWREAQGVQGTG